MLVKELIEKLEEFDGDSHVIFVELKTDSFGDLPYSSLIPTVWGAETSTWTGQKNRWVFISSHEDTRAIQDKLRGPRFSVTRE